MKKIRFKKVLLMFVMAVTLSLGATIGVSASGTKNLLPSQDTYILDLGNGATLESLGDNEYVLNGKVLATVYVGLYTDTPSTYADRPPIYDVVTENKITLEAGDYSSSMFYISGSVSGINLNYNSFGLIDANPVLEQFSGAFVNTGVDTISKTVVEKSWLPYLAINDDNTFTDFRFGLQIEEGLSATTFTAWTPPASGTGMAGQLIGIIMATITAVFSGWGSNLLTLFNNLIYTDGTGFTVFAEYMLVIIGFGLGMGVVTLLLRKVF